MVAATEKRRDENLAKLEEEDFDRSKAVCIRAKATSGELQKASSWKPLLGQPRKLASAAQPP